MVSIWGSHMTPNNRLYGIFPQIHLVTLMMIYFLLIFPNIIISMTTLEEAIQDKATHKIRLPMKAMKYKMLKEETIQGF